MNKTNHPKAGFSFEPSIFFDKKVPMKIPINAKKTIESRKRKSMFTPLITSPKNPNNELNAIINKEVPMASFIVRPVKKISAGIIKKPPPAPKNPVTIPTKDPINATFIILVLLSSTISCLDFIIE